MMLKPKMSKQNATFPLDDLLCVLGYVAKIKL